MSDITKDSLTETIVNAIRDKKGKDIKLMDLSVIEGAPAGMFIVATGNTPVQVSAIADNVEEVVRKATGQKPVNIHGNRNSQWVIVDYGYVMVHLFVPDMRLFYNLEGLWSDAPSTDIPDLD